MRAVDAEARLRELLVAGGVRLGAPTREDVAKTWDSWRRFATEPLDDVDPDPEGDALRAAFYLFDWDEEAGVSFRVSLGRQYYVDLDTFFARMLALPGFRVEVDPVGLDLYTSH